MLKRTSATCSDLATRTLSVALLTLIVGAILVPRTAKTAIVAGRTPATFAVSSSGAATYRIPLWTPPGVGEAQLDIALAYSSRSPNGILGMGWSLTGLSSITRCSKTIAQDGTPQRVLLTFEDRFCLDGQQLKLVSGPGTYGQANSVYATEIESFSRIVASSTLSGNGPTSFTMTTKNGLIYEFGLTSDAQVKPGGGATIRTWALSQIRDRVGTGNRITFTYQNDSANNTYRVSSIAYPITATGQGPFYEVLFTYAPRPSNDIPVHYASGFLSRELNRLTTITIRNFGSSTPTKTYNFLYEQGTATDRSRLYSIQECSSLNCLPATIISYQNGSRGWSSTIATAGVTTSTAGGVAPMPVDLNGDGLTDIVYPKVQTSTTSRWWAIISTVSGFAPAIDTGVVSANADLEIVGDFVGSGAQQVLFNLGGYWALMKYNAGGYFTTTSTNVPVAGEFGAVDYDGDGLQDLVAKSPTGPNIQVRRNISVPPGAVTFASTAETIFTYTGTWTISPWQASRMTQVDFDGNGRGDIYFTTFTQGPRQTTNYKGHALFSNGFGVPATHVELSLADWNPLAVDWNSDGCTDIISGPLRISNCAGGFTNVSGASSASQARLAADWDGDRRTDVLGVAVGTTTWYVYRSTGEGVLPPISTGTPAPNGTNWFVMDKDGDGLVDLGFVDTTAGNAIKYRVHSDPTMPADLATSFTDAFGINQSPSYATISRSNYTKHSDATFPEQDFQGPLYVVSNHFASDGTGTTFQNLFWYYGARVHLQGRGFEGFHSRRSYDSRSMLYLYEYYARQYPFTGMFVGRSLLQSNESTPITTVAGTPVSQTLGTDQYQQRHFPFLTPVLASRFEFGGPMNGALLSTTETATQYSDGYGNPTVIATTITDKDFTSPFYNSIWRSTANYAYLNDAGAHCLGLPLSMELTSEVTGQTTRTRQQSFAPDSINCRIAGNTIEPLISAQRITTTFNFDACGNLSAFHVVGSWSNGTAMPMRSTSLDFGPRCQLPERMLNALNHETVLTYSYDFGRPVSLRDPNLISTSWLFDDFGRLIRETRPDQTFTEYSYTRCATPPCWGAIDLRLLITETNRDATGALISTRQVYLDGFERPRSDESNRVLGTWTKSVQSYDSLGRIATVHQPHSVNSNGYTTHTYDAIGRKTAVKLYRPGGVLDRTTNISYAGDTITVTDPLGFSTQRMFDAAGRLRRIIDPGAGGTTSYDYDAFGNLNRIIDPISAESTGQYNQRGFRTQWDDADSGLWVFTPNSLNELESWTNANGQPFSVTHDSLGRITSRTEPEGTSTWIWGSSIAARNIGSLESLSGPGSSEQFFYDSIGRLATHRVNSDEQYQFDYTYNSIGAIDTVTYPASPIPADPPGQTGSRFKIRYLYSFGYPFQIMDVTEVTPSTIWTLIAANDYSSITSETLGNNLVNISASYKAWTNELEALTAGVGGSATNRQNLTYQWDLNGNLQQRRDVTQNLTEAFTYDELNRVKTSTLNGAQNLSVDYDTAGRILNKFPAPGSYTYGDPDHPHAVTAAGTESSLQYDDNGNSVARNGLSQTWASFDLPTLLQATIEGSTWQSQLFYGPDHQKWKQVSTYVNGTETTHYVGGLLEKVHATSTGLTYWRHYVHTPSGMTLVVSRNSDQSQSKSYVLADHLGSSDVAIDHLGNEFLRESFSAFGERRGGNWSATTPPNWGAIADLTRRGFTWHEHLDNIRLIHMGGRVYDPVLGRFLSTDPIIGDLSDSQSTNQYSYVANRPLSFVDPTGLCMESPGDFGCTIRNAEGGNILRTIGDIAADLLSWFGFFGGKPLPPPATTIPGTSAQRGGSGICDLTSFVSCQGGVPNIGNPMNLPPVFTFDGSESGPMPGESIGTPNNSDVTVRIRLGGLSYNVSAENDVSQVRVTGIVHKRLVFTLACPQPSDVVDDGGACDAGQSTFESDPITPIFLGPFRIVGPATQAGRLTARAIGARGERELARMVGGRGPVFLRTEAGGARFVDRLAFGRAYESKVGYTSLTRFVKSQIEKDAQLILDKRVSGVTWVFFRSPVTGRGGPSGPLREALRKANIDIKVIDNVPGL